MHAQLMRAAGERLEREPGELPSRAPITFHVVTAGWPCGSCFIHQPRRLVEAAERQIDAAFVLRRAAFDHRPIGLADLAGLEQLAELGQRLAVAAEHQAAGGVAVEPVRERGRARQPEAQRAEMVLQALAALRPAWTAKPAGLSITSISPSR